MVPLAVILLAGSFMVSLLLAAGVLRMANRLQLVAVPNERSSHDTVKPTLGGVAIVLPVLGFLGYAATVGDPVAMGILVSAGALALVGLVDDLRDLGTAFRFACQILAVVILLGYLALDVHWLVWWLIALLVLWHVNLFNFMDGIDGIAGVQTLIFCVGVQLLAGGFDGLAGQLIWVMSGATVGFLAFNWPPARLFMGDVGSLFLGLLIASLVVLLHTRGSLGCVSSIILLTGFWFDASYTLCVRMLTGQPFTQPHRSHLYQRLTDRLGHQGTTLLFALVGIIWLLPLAWLADRYVVWSPLLPALATLPYLCAAVVLRAGRVSQTGKISPS